MAESVSLVPLFCTQCKAPVPAQAGEIAWVCQQCQQGLLLDEDKGLLPYTLYFHAAIQPGSVGLPYWIASGAVRLNRKIYGFGSSENEAARLWAEPRLFFVPAYTCPLDKMLQIAPRMLLQPPKLQAGPLARFAPVTLSMADIQPLTEFIVMGIEAGRKDKLKELNLSVTLGAPQLWVLPA